TFNFIKDDINIRRATLSIAEMQACLAQLYVDDAFRKLYYINPDSTLKGYELTEDEANAIKNIEKKWLDAFAESLKNKRKRRFESAYPLTFALETEHMDRYFNRFYQL